MCGGNDILFESNVIEHTNYECDDSGSFYTCGQQGAPIAHATNHWLVVNQVIGSIYWLYVLNSMYSWCLVVRRCHCIASSGTAWINRGNILRNNTFRRVRQEVCDPLLTDV